MCLLEVPISRGRGAGRLRKLEDRDRFSGDGAGRPERGGKGSSVGLSKNDDVLLACGLGTVALALTVVVDATRPNSEMSPSLFNLGKVEPKVDGARRGEAFGEGANGGGGRFNGRGGLTSVAQEVLNRSLREVESERGLVVVVILGVCVVSCVCRSMQAYYVYRLDMY